MNYDKLFWTGVIAYITSTLFYILGREGKVGFIYWMGVVAAISMFVGSKIGRSFLGLA